MVPIHRWLLIAAALTVITAAISASAEEMGGWNDKQIAKRLSDYAKLTPQTFARSITISDDDLEPIAFLTTEKGYLYKGGFTDTVRSDTFLRALIDKSTKKVSYQLYVELRYTGPDRRFVLGTVSSETGPLAVSPTFDHHGVDCPYGTCLRTDVVALPLTEEMVRSIGSKAGLKPVQPWRFRLKSQIGLDWTDDLPPAEAAGLLLAVDSWRTKAAR